MDTLGPSFLEPRLRILLVLQQILGYTFEVLNIFECFSTFMSGHTWKLMILHSALKETEAMSLEAMWISHPPWLPGGTKEPISWHTNSPYVGCQVLRHPG